MAAIRSTLAKVGKNKSYQFDKPGPSRASRIFTGGGVGVGSTCQPAPSQKQDTFPTLPQFHLASGGPVLPELASEFLDITKGVMRSKAQTLKVLEGMGRSVPTALISIDTNVY